MGGGDSDSDRSAVKVVIINTEYVETDALSFKSVVQRLTGKDAVVAVKPRGYQSAAAAKAPVMERLVSFKDFDWMLKELPTLDELYSLYADC